MITHNDHASLKWKSKSEIGIEALVAQSYAPNGRVDNRLTCAGNVVNVHTERMANTVREECRRIAGSNNSFLRVPGSGAWRLWGFEDTKLLEAFYKCAVTNKLDSIPMKTGSDDVE